MKKIIILTFLISFNLFADEKFFYFFGGGGEPLGKTTIFDYNLKTAGAFVRKSDWKTTISFDGDHSKTEKIIAHEFIGTSNAGNFTKNNIEALIADLLLKLNSGRLKKGDQLLLTIDTHGREKIEDENNHHIALLHGEEISLDLLKPVIALATKKEVKLAIVDLSCFSGITLDIGNEKICIITSTGANHSAYSGES